MEDFLVDIPSRIKTIAKSVAERQADPNQRSRVYQNSLATYAVNFYLRCMGVSVDLSKSDSQDILFQTLSDTGALMLTHIGKLECRPVAHDANEMHVPEAVWGDRIGYLAIQFNQDGSEASLLGFVKTVDSTTVPLSQLESLSAFLDYLDQLKHQPQAQSNAVLASSVNRLLDTPPVNRLSQWLEQTFEFGWQLVEDLKDDWMVAPSEPAMQFRKSRQLQSIEMSEAIKCEKSLTVGEDSKNAQIKLRVGIRPNASDEYDILVGLYPSNSPYLLPNLRLLLLDDVDEVILQAQSKSQNDSLHFVFGGNSGDRFSVKIQYRQAVIQENFLI